MVGSGHGDRKTREKLNLNKPHLAQNSWKLGKHLICIISDSNIIVLLLLKLFLSPAGLGIVRALLGRTSLPKSWICCHIEKPALEYN